ncbi:MAG: 4Fe-4S double cluster binding domain-containing protein [Clostridia bacterium]|nr:4Fe-4S double cluster binding domain-containing protein [Clostridia bacterium]
MNITEKITELLKSEGAADVGFSKIGCGPFGESTYAVSIVIKLSEAVVDEIDAEPTHTYFHHYRTVNAYIDRLCLRVGFLLEQNGYKYIPIAASQSINKDGWNYEGRFSHKKAASLAGLGGIGKNGLFLHKDYGPRVRLGTVLTDCNFDIKLSEYKSPCIGCDACVNACPSGAIKGKLWQEGMDRSEVLDPAACSNYMKKAFKHIGRGAVCGICMSVCPIGKKISRE